MDSSTKILATQLILAVLIFSVATVTGTTRQISELLGGFQDALFGRFGCPQYARNDCRQICQPNDYKLNCEEYPERPATCMCFCPSMNTLYNFCEYAPSSYCTVACGRGGIGYRCMGPSGAQQCACFCPLNRQAFEAHTKAAAKMKIPAQIEVETHSNVNDTISIAHNAPVWWNDLDI